MKIKIERWATGNGVFLDVDGKSFAFHDSEIKIPGKEIEITTPDVIVTSELDMHPRAEIALREEGEYYPTPEEQEFANTAFGSMAGGFQNGSESTE